MRRTDFTSVSCSVTAPRRWRLRLVVFLVRMWRLNACPRLIEPLARTSKRFAALFLVFIFGIVGRPSSWMTAGAPCGDFGARLHLLSPPTLPARCGLPLPSSGSRRSDRRRRRCETYFFFFGASTITICRPSSFGI